MDRLDHRGDPAGEDAETAFPDRVVQLRPELGSHARICHAMIYSRWSPGLRHEVLWSQYRARSGGVNTVFVTSSAGAACRRARIGGNRTPVKKRGYRSRDASQRAARSATDGTPAVPGPSTVSAPATAA